MTSGAEVDPGDLKQLLGKLRDLPPKVRTATRRELRSVGDDTIEAQKAILDGPLPQGVEKTGQRFEVRKTRTRDGVKFRTIRVNTYADVAVKQGGSSGLREGIKAGLKLRVVTGKTRQGIELKTTGPKRDGYNAAKFWEAKHFRHPVFGRKTYVDQAGQPYFRGPALAGRDEMVRRAEKILRDAVRED